MEYAERLELRKRVKPERMQNGLKALMDMTSEGSYIFEDIIAVVLLADDRLKNETASL